MANTFSVKCDMCGTVETSENGHGLTMARFVMNVETKHACRTCWEVLQGMFKAGIEGVRDPLKQVHRLTEQLDGLRSSLRLAENKMSGLQHNIEWTKGDFENMRDRMHAISTKYQELMREGETLFRQFEDLQLTLESGKQNWGAGFWTTLAFFDRSKKTFMARADTIIQSMERIRTVWSKDKQPSPQGLPAPKRGVV